MLPFLLRDPKACLQFSGNGNYESALERLKKASDAPSHVLLLRGRQSRTVAALFVGLRGKTHTLTPVNVILVMVSDSKALSFGVFLGDIVMKLKMRRSKQLRV